MGARTDSFEPLDGIIDTTAFSQARYYRSYWYYASGISCYSPDFEGQKALLNMVLPKDREEYVKQGRVEFVRQTYNDLFQEASAKAVKQVRGELRAAKLTKEETVAQLVVASLRIMGQDKSIKEFVTTLFARDDQIKEIGEKMIELDKGYSDLNVMLKSELPYTELISDPNRWVEKDRSFIEEEEKAWETQRRRRSRLRPRSVKRGRLTPRYA
ncbi:hypothetical protein AKJ16_DCAP12965 [Drosera capensis]